MEFKVMTFNIHHGEGTDKRLDLSRIAEVIEKSNADIIGLNEVDVHFSKRSQFQDQISWLANHLNLNKAFSPSVSRASNQTTIVKQYGNALLSRYPIISSKSHLLNFLPGLIEGRSILDATIQLNNQFVQVNVTHLSLNPILHSKQTDFIMNLQHHPRIIMGDFNMRPTSRGWSKLTDKYQDIWNFSGTGAGFTYPSYRPRNRLDYLFVSPDFKVIEAEVVTMMPMASDHLPLTATLSL